MHLIHNVVADVGHHGRRRQSLLDAGKNPFRGLALVTADVRHCSTTALPCGERVLHPRHRQDIGARKDAVIHLIREPSGVNRDAGTLVFDDHTGELFDQPAQAGRKSFDPRFSRGQVGMGGAFAADLNLQPMKAGVIHVIGQARARAQVIEAPAADDAERNTRRAADRAEQLPALRSQLGRGGIGIEFRERSVGVEEQHKRGAGRAPRHLGLNFRKHLTEHLHQSLL
jgi:hypothetical protein